MDVAKYIGLYLLKNKFCYLHGLGNLQLKKKPATYDGEVISAAQYEVTLSPTGSIDDSLANFIATAEQTSISKSSNEIREFVAGMKVDLAEGKEVTIPGLGHFTAAGGGAVRFVSDANLAYVPPPIPTLRMSERLEDAPSFKRNTPEEDSKAERSGINRTKVLITIFSAIVIVAIIIAAVVFYNNRPTTESVQTAPQVTEEPMPTPTYADSNGTVQPAGDFGTLPAAATTPTTGTANAGSGSWKIVLNSYSTLPAAQKRVRFLQNTALGNVVTLVSVDSTQHFVTIPFTAPAADSTRTLDSLSRVYGTKARLLK
jgi:hypothetical protein